MIGDSRWYRKRVDNHISMNSDLRSIDFILISSTDYSEKICYNSFLFSGRLLLIFTMRKDIGLKQALSRHVFTSVIL